MALSVNTDKIQTKICQKLKLNSKQAKENNKTYKKNSICLPTSASEVSKSLLHFGVIIKKERRNTSFWDSLWQITKGYLHVYCNKTENETCDTLNTTTNLPFFKLFFLVLTLIQCLKTLMLALVFTSLSSKGIFLGFNLNAIHRRNLRSNQDIMRAFLLYC